MKNLKIKAKLILGFSIITFFTVIVATVGIVGTINMSNADEKLYNEQITPIMSIFSALDHVQHLRIQARDLVFNAGDIEKIQSIGNEMNKNFTNIDTILASHDTTTEDSSISKLFETAKEQYSTIFRPELLKLIDAAKKGASAETIRSMMSLITPATVIIVSNFNEYIESNMATTEITTKNNAALSRAILTIIIIVLIIVFIISITLAAYISNLISKPLQTLSGFFTNFGITGELSLSQNFQSSAKNIGRDEIGQCFNAAIVFVEHLISIKEKLTQVADGDLTVDIEVLSDKDSLGFAISNMVDKFNIMFYEIQTASNQVSSGAEQISQISHGLASGSSQQAASIEEFSASLTELQNKIEYNAKNSEKSHIESKKAEIMLSDSINSMEKLLEAMKGIDDSSKNINKIIKVIDDIAFQTNILALNAAVEAARAGQHGKGFAVVAEEVRKLARKSAEAAKETAVLIEGSSQKVIEGNEFVTKTHSSLKLVAVGASESGQLLHDVVTASVEQCTAIKEMSLGIEQISTVVQSNSATAQQSSAASEEMSAQSTTLNNILSNFKLKQSIKQINLTPTQNIRSAQSTPNISSKQLTTTNASPFGKY